MHILWHTPGETFAIMDRKGSIYLIREGHAPVMLKEADELTVETQSLSLHTTANLYALTTETSAYTASRPRVQVYSLEQENGVQSKPIYGFGYPVWHRTELLLAGHHFPEKYLSDTNIVGVADTSLPQPTLVNRTELDRSAIAEVLGWSATGQIIAVSQYKENGLTPHYLFPDDDGRVQDFLFFTASYSCVLDGQWSPESDVLAFTAVNETMEGWDIFLETVAAPQNGHEGSFLNLTNSPQEDKRDVAWSPGGDDS